MEKVIVMKARQINSKNDVREIYTGTTQRIDFLSKEEQRQLIRGSYCHQYGVLIRLTMFTGLRIDELLGLQWDDVDIYNRKLFIRNRLEIDVKGLGIRRSNSPRIIPLLPHVFKDLMKWREERKEDVKSIIPFRWHPNSVATLITGYQINRDCLMGLFHEIMEFSGLPNYSYSVLRNTFAIRSLEQGMDLNMLCNIMGDSTAAKTYAQYMSSCKESDIAIMETLLTVQQSNDCEITYPVVVKSLANGLTQLYAPNFPEATCAGPILTDGIIIMREKIEDELRYIDCPPIPVPVSDIPCGLGECIIQISLKL